MASTTTRTGTARVEPISPPTWIKPQLAALVKAAPDGSDWLHEIKMDGYRMHARLDAGRVQILTRRGNIWTDKYPAIAQAVCRAAGEERLSRWRTLRSAPRWPDGVQPHPERQRHRPGFAGVLPLRSVVPRRRGLDRAAPGRPQGPTGETTDWRTAVPPVQRSPDRPRPGIPPAGVRARARRNRLEAHRRPIRARPPIMAEDEVPEPRGIRRRRLERSGGQPTPDRLAASRLLHAGG